MDFKTATLTKKLSLTEDTYEFRFRPDPNFTYLASQFITVKIPITNRETVMRSYSFSCKPAKNYFELCIKLLPDGKGSNYFKNLKQGEKIEFLGPLGHFKFKSAKNKTAIFISTGTGIAPIKSMIEDQLNQGNIQRMHLIFGLRYIKDIIYKKFFERLVEKHSNFTFQITLSRPEDPSWKENGGTVGRVTDILKNMEIDQKNTDFYTCGLKDMVIDTISFLEQKGLPKEALNCERFN